MGRVGQSEFDHQSLHQIKALTKKKKKKIFRQNITDFCVFLVNIFGTVTPTSHQSFGKEHFNTSLINKLFRKKKSK